MSVDEPMGFREERPLLHHLTHASIALGEMAEGPLVDVWSCGCQHFHVGRKRWNLCRYHEGFDDGAELAS